MSDAVLAIAAELSVEPIFEKLVHSARELVDARYAALGVPDGRGGFARGHANKLIALDLGVSEKTVKTQVSNILGKLGVNDRTQAALYAVREGIVGPGS